MVACQPGNRTVKRKAVKTLVISFDCNYPYALPHNEIHVERLPHSTTRRQCYSHSLITIAVLKAFSRIFHIRVIRKIFRYSIISGVISRIFDFLIENAQRVIVIFFLVYSG